MSNVRTILVGLFLSFSVSSLAQVTTFMGIPVDGTVDEMIKKLEHKGFELEPMQSTVDESWLEGEFNGKDVAVAPITNKDEVWRILVMHDALSADLVARRFASTIMQLESKSSYTTSEIIPTVKELEKEVHHLRIKSALPGYAFFQDGDPMRRVWVTVYNEDYSDYYLWIFYDNLYNAPNGEDL